MLTSSDLKQIKQLLNGFKEELKEYIDQRIDESNLEIQKEITLLKAEMKREFRRVHQDQNLIIKHFNEEFLGLQERVEKLEQRVPSQTY